MSKSLNIYLDTKLTPEMVARGLPGVSVISQPTQGAFDVRVGDLNGTVRTITTSSREVIRAELKVKVNLEILFPVNNSFWNDSLEWSDLLRILETAITSSACVVFARNDQLIEFVFDGTDLYFDSESTLFSDQDRDRIRSNHKTKSLSALW